MTDAMRASLQLYVHNSLSMAQDPVHPQEKTFLHSQFALMLCRFRPRRVRLARWCDAVACNIRCCDFEIYCIIVNDSAAANIGELAFWPTS